MQAITNKAEPNQVSVHALILAIVLSRKEMDPTEKVKKLIDVICFKISPKEIQLQEVQYLFHLMYKWIEATTMLKIKTSQLQTKVEDQCFKSDDVSKIDDIVKAICDQEEIPLLFGIFTKSTRNNRLADNSPTSK